jgi:hypothetical protein
MEQVSLRWWIAAILKSLIIATVILAMKWLAIPAGELDRGRFGDPIGLLRLAGGITVLALLALAGIWSWQRLAPIYRDADGERRYDFGILFVGLGTMLTVMALQSYERAGGAGLGALWTRDFWATLAIGSLVAFPMGLWMGRAWNHLMGTGRSE